VTIFSEERVMFLHLKDFRVFSMPGNANLRKSC